MPFYRNLKKIICSLFLVIFFLGGCTERQRDLPTITIAEQYGLAYAPLQIMRVKGFLEEINPDAEVNWVTLGNTAAIRDAVLSGDVDAGFLGIPPFLIAFDKGMEWKIATGLSRAPLGLVINDDLIEDASDFKEDLKLALPQPGSIQHILLSMAMERSYGDSALLDDCLVAMKHPDGMNALLSGAVAGHFTSPPYLYREMDQPGFSLLVDGEEAMGGPFTFIVGMVTDEFHRNSPDLYEDYLEALDRSIDYINSHEEDTIKILSEEYSLDPDTLYEYIYKRGIVYSGEILGLEKFIDFMAEQGMISREISGEGVFIENP